jgi:hypothetical protein
VRKFSAGWNGFVMVFWFPDNLLELVTHSFISLLHSIVPGTAEHKAGDACVQDSCHDSDSEEPGPATRDNSLQLHLIGMTVIAWTW